MRLVNAKLGVDLFMRENEVSVLSIENPNNFSMLLRALSMQIETGEEDFILSDAEKDIKLEKQAMVIFNPLDIDLNDRKLYTKFLQILQEESRDFLQEDYMKIKGVVYQYFEKLGEHVPFDMEYDTEVQETALYKLFSLKIKKEEGTVGESIASYVKLAQQLLNIRLVIVVNLKDYLSEEDLLLLYQEFYYNKVQLLVIEGRKNKTLSGEHGIIWDNDQCFISY